MIRFLDWGQGKNATLFVFSNIASGQQDSPIIHPKGQAHIDLHIKCAPLSEMTMNLLKNHVPISQDTLKSLSRYKKPLRTLGNKTASLKTRRNVLMTQSGAGFWKGMKYIHQCCCKRQKRNQQRAWRRRTHKS